MEEHLERVPLQTADGPICGYAQTKEDNTYYWFKGIPYAKPPIGRLRFMRPVPIAPWTEELDCTTDPPSPFMINPRTKKYEGSEDCLYIRVVTPCLKPVKPLPVLFWMGNYMFFTNLDRYCNPRLLVDEGTVFVLCGSRLGPFGYLSVNDHAAPGNAGLKDVVLALKWVQRNIRAFGGDPDNVTIFGNSAGGVSVHLMLLSPMAYGLFHKAIIQSGSALHNWSYTKNASKVTIELAKELNISASCKTEIVETLKTLPAESIMEATVKIWQQKIVGAMDHINPIFKPCIEVDLEGEQAFLSKSPDLIIKSGNFSRVPIIFGSVNLEARAISIISRDFCENDAYSQFAIHFPFKGEVTKDLIEKLMQFYVGDVPGGNTKERLLQLYSDIHYHHRVNVSVKSHKRVAPESPIYYYVMNHVGDWMVTDEDEWINSAGHGADIPNLFEIVVNGLTGRGSREALTVRQKVVRMWTNFAKFGNPTPDDGDPILQITWDPVTSEDLLDYLNIGAELTKGRNPFRERMEFCDQLHAEHTFLRALIYMNDISGQWM